MIPEGKRKKRQAGNRWHDGILAATGGVMKRGPLIACVVWMLISTAVIDIAEGQEHATLQESFVGSAVKDLDRTVQQIVQLLRQQIQLQQTNQLMQRVELQRRALRPLEDELRRMRAERRNLERNRREAMAQVEFFEEEMEREIETGRADEGDQRILRRRLQLDLEMLAEQLQDLDQRILDAEVDLQRMEGQILDWEEVLDEKLQLP
jgi:hypothetical protein